MLEKEMNPKGLYFLMILTSVISPHDWKWFMKLSSVTYSARFMTWILGS
jgi:hypothetical protein